MLQCCRSVDLSTPVSRWGVGVVHTAALTRVSVATRGAPSGLMVTWGGPHALSGAASLDGAPPFGPSTIKYIGVALYLG